jgi:hypothetical protein
MLKMKQISEITPQVRTVLLVFAIMLAPIMVLAQPEGATSTVVSSERKSSTSATTIDAIAGNVTELDIVSVAITQTWSGFFGNVSGTITLDDANNFTFYDWQTASPQGEIFAVNETITWTNISCFNYTATGGSGELNLSEYETFLSLASTAVDGVDETFQAANHPQFFVGAVTIPTNTCNTTHTYVNDTAQSTFFKEVLLYDPDKNVVVFTSLIEKDVFGFDNRTHDFQMLVAEDAHNADTQTTPYYFYVELD